MCDVASCFGEQGRVCVRGWGVCNFVWVSPESSQVSFALCLCAHAQHLRCLLVCVFGPSCGWECVCGPLPRHQTGRQVPRLLSHLSLLLGHSVQVGRGG